ncbi:hypothetical protein ACU6U9_02540 [Pseudomonas sp. HK3]
MNEYVIWLADAIGQLFSLTRGEQAIIIERVEQVAKYPVAAGRRAAIVGYEVQFGMSGGKLLILGISRAEYDEKTKSTIDTRRGG